MNSTRIPTDLKSKAWEFVSNNNMGQRHDFNGTKEQQYAGLVGENMIRKALGFEYSFEPGYDGGYDIMYEGTRIDVKTMTRSVDPKPHYVNNFVGYQKNLPCDMLVFCSINKKTGILWVCGFTTKSRLLKEAEFFEAGSIRTRDDGTTMKVEAPLYEISNEKLFPLVLFP